MIDFSNIILDYETIIEVGGHSVDLRELPVFKITNSYGSKRIHIFKIRKTSEYNDNEVRVEARLTGGQREWVTPARLEEYINTWSEIRILRSEAGSREPAT